MYSLSTKLLQRSVKSQAKWSTISTLQLQPVGIAAASDEACNIKGYAKQYQSNTVWHIRKDIECEIFENIMETTNKSYIVGGKQRVMMTAKK
ncbi:unnamed protein product, partial [Ceratitis capitata]